LEVGIFKKSVLILHKSFYPLDRIKKSMDYQKRSNLINQIRQMAEVVLKGKLQLIDNEAYRIYFSILKSYKNVFIYAIDDKKSSEEIVKKLLKTILKKFQDYYPQLSSSSKIEEVNQYKNFNQIIENTLSDERFTPLDRIKRFLL
jgi:predicted aminopeptidase